MFGRVSIPKPNVRNSNLASSALEDGDDVVATTPPSESSDSYSSERDAVAPAAAAPPNGDSAEELTKASMRALRSTLSTSERAKFDALRAGLSSEGPGPGGGGSSLAREPSVPPTGGPYGNLYGSALRDDGGDETPNGSSDDVSLSSSSSTSSRVSVSKVAKLLSKKPRGGLKKIGRVVSGGGGGSRKPSESSLSSSSGVEKGGGGVGGAPRATTNPRVGRPRPRRDSLAPGAIKSSALGGGGGGGKPIVRNRRKKKKKRKSVAWASATSSSASDGRPKLETIKSARLTALHRAATAGDPSRRDVLKASAPRKASSRGFSTRDLRGSLEHQRSGRFVRSAPSEAAPAATGRGDPPRAMGSLCADSFGESDDDEFARLRHLPPTEKAKPTAAATAVGRSAPPPPPLQHKERGKSGGSVGEAVKNSLAGGWKRAKEKEAGFGDSEDDEFARLRHLPPPTEKARPTASAAVGRSAPPPPPLQHKDRGKSGGSVGEAVKNSLAGGGRKRAKEKKAAKNKNAVRFDLHRVDGGDDSTRPSEEEGGDDERNSESESSVASSGSSSTMGMKGGAKTREELLHDAKLKFNLAKVYIRTNQLDKARDTLNKALRARMMLFGVDSVQVGEVHELLGDVAAKSGKVEVGRRHYNAALRMLDADLKNRKKQSRPKPHETEAERVLRITTNRGVDVNECAMREIRDIRKRVKKSLNELPRDDSSDELSVVSCGLPSLAPRKSRGNPRQSIMPAKEMMSDLAKLEKFLPSEEHAPPRPLTRSSSYADFEAGKRHWATARTKLFAVNAVASAGRAELSRTATAVASAERRRSVERSSEDESCGSKPSFVDPRHQHSPGKGGKLRLSSVTVTDVSAASGAGDGPRSDRAGGGGTAWAAAAAKTQLEREGWRRSPTTMIVEGGASCADAAGGPPVNGGRQAAREGCAGSRDEPTLADGRMGDGDNESVLSDPVGEKEKVASRRKSMSSPSAAMYKAMAEMRDLVDSDEDSEEDSTDLLESERSLNIPKGRHPTAVQYSLGPTEAATDGSGMREVSRLVKDRRKDGARRDLYQAGLVHALRGSFRGASTRFREVLDKPVEDDDDRQESVEVAPLVLNSLGNIRYQQGNYEAAIEFYKKSLNGRIDHIDDDDHRREMAATTINLGKANLELGEHDRAVGCFERAAKMLWTSDAEDKETEVAFLVGMIGIAHYRKGEYERAMKFFVKSLSAKKKILKDESHPEILILRRNVGLCLFQLGRLDESIALFKLLLEKWRVGGKVVYDAGSRAAEINRHDEIARLLEDLAEAHLERGLADMANASELLEASMHRIDDAATSPPVSSSDDPSRSRAELIASKLEVLQHASGRRQ